MYSYTEPKMFDWMYCFNENGEINTYCCVVGSGSGVTPPTSKEPSKLYHYTSLDSFCKIVSTKKMYLTSLFNMNDTKEVIWFYRLLNSQIAQLHLSQDKIANAVRAITRINLQDAYSVCFTTLKDKNGKWDTYGVKHTGVCFEINPKILPITRDLPMRDSEGSICLYTCAFLKVNYNQNIQKKTIKDILKLAIKDKNNFFNYANYLSKVAYTCKNPSYSDENEWRILYTPLCKNPTQKIEILDNKEFKISSIKSHIKNGKPSQYCEIPILDGFITKVIIGSKCTATINDIKTLLNNSQYNTTEHPIIIEKSKI